MRQLFISYARENKPDVEALVRDLHALGHQTWVDSSLRGGQTWWHEILQRIADSDVFVAIVSGHTLSSVACKRELEWALALNKPVLPLAVERLPDALPRTLSMRQIIDYSQSGREAAFALAGALGTLPPAPPAPEQLPEPPAAPLSYLSDLVEQVGQSEPLTQQQQHQILIQLEPALRSADAEERRGGRYVLEMFSRRGDLYADVDRTLAQMDLADHDTETRSAHRVAAGVHEAHSSTPSAAHVEGRGSLLADPQWADALSSFFAERWAEAVERFEALQASHPGEGRVETRLKEARRQRDIDVWSSKAEASAAERDWDIVVTALENLTALDPAYPDVGARLEQARMAQRRRALVDEMTALHQVGRWNAVVAAARELARIDPDNSDPGGIVSDARAKIHGAGLADRYAQALNHLDQEQWQQAADLLAAIEQEQPGYRDVAALLKTAQRQRAHKPSPKVSSETSDATRRSGAGIFISYRREDERNFAGRLYERLARHYDEHLIFMDVDSVELGLDFTEVIDHRLAQCSVVLVVIGNKWVNCTDSDGRLRLDNPDDFVRLEVESALARRDVRVIPILVDGASVPKSIDLPESLRSLTRRNALNMSHESFGTDFGRLHRTLERTIHR